jgi:general secretion pathway protein M
MSPLARQGLSAAGFFAIVVLLGGGAISTALALRDEQAEVSALTAQDQALEARAHRAAPNKQTVFSASPFVSANTITQAGAMLQQRVESAVAAAGGVLASSRVDVGANGDKKRVALEAELTIAQPQMQKLIYDLETGQPYLFVEAFEARMPEGDAQDAGHTHVTLTISGEWGGPE